MHVGVPTETGLDEFRVGLTPAVVRTLTTAGHTVIIQSGAGEGAGIQDADYKEQGAEVVTSAQEVYGDSQLISKIKPPSPEDVGMLTPRHILFSFLHLAPNRSLTEQLLASGATCIGFESVTDSRNRLPLLEPMSVIAGRLATQSGAKLLERPSGGPGVLIGGVPGVASATVVILGGGVVGTNAAAAAVGLGARVIVFDNSIDRLAELDAHFGGQIETRYSTPLSIELALFQADLVIGAVLVRGALTPTLVTESQLSTMRQRSVLVDVSIDQGGCFATSRPTSHSQPTFMIDGVLHYCVTNMPGAVPATSSHALANAAAPFVALLADHGHDALRLSPELAAGVNIVDGHVTSPAVSVAVDLPYTGYSDRSMPI